MALMDNMRVNQQTLMGLVFCEARCYDLRGLDMREQGPSDETGSGARDEW